MGYGLDSIETEADAPATAEPASDGWNAQDDEMSASGGLVEIPTLDVDPDESAASLAIPMLGSARNETKEDDEEDDSYGDDSYGSDFD